MQHDSDPGDIAFIHDQPVQITFNAHLLLKPCITGFRSGILDGVLNDPFIRSRGVCKQRRVIQPFRQGVIRVPDIAGQVFFCGGGHGAQKICEGESQRQHDQKQRNQQRENQETVLQRFVLLQTGIFPHRFSAPSLAFDGPHHDAFGPFRTEKLSPVAPMILH